MKKILYIISFLSILTLVRTEIKASCPHSVIFQHDNGMISNVIDNQHPSSVDRYWYLSVASTNNNGFNTSWFQQYSGGLLFISGSWGDPFVQGCCFCSDPVSYPSRTMMFKLEQNRNPNTALHSGEYTVELCEGSVNYCFLTRSYNRPFSAISTFHIKNYTSTGEGLTTTVEIGNWGTVVGPVHYWIKRADGSEGEDLPLNPRCQPDCQTTCPEPIVGYNILAIAAGSAPTQGNYDAWNLNVTGGTITLGIPNFPFSVQIQNPVSCTSSNQYIYVATQLIFEGRITSYYISEIIYQKIQNR